MPFDAIDGSDREILMRRHDNSPLLSTQKPRPLGGRGFLDRTGRCDQSQTLMVRRRKPNGVGTRRTT